MISGRKLLTYDDYGERVWHPATVFGTNFGILYWLGFTAIYWGVFYRYFLVPSQKQCFDDAKDLVGLNINLRNVIGFIIPVMLTIGFLLLSFNEALAKPSATRSFEMLHARIAMALGAAFLTVVVQQLIAPFVTALMLFSGFMAYMAGLPIDLSRLQLAIIELFGILPEEIIDILGVSKSTVAFVFAFFAPAISILALFKSLSQDRL